MHICDDLSGSASILCRSKTAVLDRLILATVEGSLFYSGETFSEQPWARSTFRKDVTCIHAKATR